jgi:HSF-type DNA-binding
MNYPAPVKLMEVPHSVDEHAAATAVAALGKRDRDGDSAGRMQSKLARSLEQTMVMVGPPRPPPPQEHESEEKVLKPFPFFYYLDFSTQVDPDPLIPVTSPGRVPNFPAKMHSILSRPDLADLVAWMPHGRSWRVLKPREFEISVIPTYFEHAKFSSFIRQANGWGFRRITQGRDRNSYYHEQFLRGLPHLCKMMKRPGVSEKQASDPEHEPDFYKIDEEHPVPERAADESILLQCTLQGGPKARMPIYFGSLSLNSPSTSPPLLSLSKPTVSFEEHKLVPNEPLMLNSFQPMSSAPYNQRCRNVVGNSDSAPQQMQASQPQHSFTSTPLQAMNINNFPLHQPTQAQHKAQGTDNATASNQLGLVTPPNVAAALQASSAASQFAAGFAAATAISQEQFRTILGQALAAATKQQAPQFQAAIVSHQ